MSLGADAESSTLQIFFTFWDFPGAGRALASANAAGQQELASNPKSYALHAHPPFWHHQSPKSKITSLNLGIRKRGIA
jgi:hypothetical protein